MHLTAAVAAIMTLTVFGAQASESMNAAQIEDAFRGITLDGVYDNGGFFSETYFDDGSIRYHDVFGADSGNWSVRENMFCTFYQGQQGACFFVFREGANCFIFFEPTEGANGTLVPDDNWTSRGWNRHSEVSCVEPPEVLV